MPKEHTRQDEIPGHPPCGAVFPCDFVPLTLGDDGDPLNVLVLMDAPAFAGAACPAVDRRDRSRADRGRESRAKRSTHRRRVEVGLGREGLQLRICSAVRFRHYVLTT
jgi:hypothetical protein